MNRTHKIAGTFESMHTTLEQFVKHQLQIYYETICVGHANGMSPYEMISDITIGCVQMASAQMQKAPDDAKNLSGCFASLVTMNSAMMALLGEVMKNDGDMAKVMAALPTCFEILGTPPAWFRKETVQ